MGALCVAVVGALVPTVRPSVLQVDISTKPELASKVEDALYVWLRATGCGVAAVGSSRFPRLEEE